MANNILTDNNQHEESYEVDQEYEPESSFNLKWLWGLLPLVFLLGFVALVAFQLKNKKSTNSKNAVVATSEVNSSETSENTAAYNSEGSTENEDADYKDDSNYNSESTSGYTGIDERDDYEEQETTDYQYEDSQSNSTNSYSTKSTNATYNSGNQAGGYYVVFDVFSNKNNAIVQKVKTEQAGFNKVSIMPHGNLFRVVNYLGTNEQEAETKVKQIKHHYKKDAWLLEY